MTANAFKEDQEACISAGMCEYASKPVKWDDLKTLIIKAYKVINNNVSCICQNERS